MWLRLATGKKVISEDDQAGKERRIAYYLYIYWRQPSFFRRRLHGVVWEGFYSPCLRRWILKAAAGISSRNFSFYKVLTGA